MHSISSASSIAPPDLPELTVSAAVVILAVALVIDATSAGPQSIRDRVAFVLVLGAGRTVFDGSATDQALENHLRQALHWAATAQPDPRLSWGIQNLTDAVVLCLVVLAIGALAPVRSSWLGGLSRITLETRGRVNWRLWSLALLLGCLSDLSDGAVGATGRWMATASAAGGYVVGGFLFGSA